MVSFREGEEVQIIKVQPFYLKTHCVLWSTAELNKKQRYCPSLGGPSQAHSISELSGAEGPQLATEGLKQSQSDPKQAQRASNRLRVTQNRLRGPQTGSE